MTNTDKLKQIGEIYDIRERLGWDENSDPTEIDEQIDNMSPEDIAKAWAGWNLGDESWATQILNIYKRMAE